MEVAKYSEVLNIPNNFLEPDFCERCINIIQYSERIENSERYNVYIYLKEKFVCNFIDRSLISLFHVAGFSCVLKYY